MEIPTTGQRNTLKIFGTIELYRARFLYHFQKVFNAESYLAYLERIVRCYFPQKVYLIQDNASYHQRPGRMDMVCRPPDTHRVLQSSRIFPRTQCRGENLASHPSARYTQSILCDPKRASLSLDFNVSQHPEKSISDYGLSAFVSINIMSALFMQQYIINQRVS